MGLFDKAIGGFEKKGLGKSITDAVGKAADDVNKQSEKWKGGAQKKEAEAKKHAEERAKEIEKQDYENSAKTDYDRQVREIFSNDSNEASSSSAQNNNDVPPPAYDDIDRQDHNTPLTGAGSDSSSHDNTHEA